MPSPLSRARTAALALTFPLLLAACGDDSGEEVSSRATTPIPEPSFPAITDTALAAGPGSDWPTHGGDLANRRYSPLDQIDRSSVGELVPVWVHSTGIEGAFETTPIVAGNTMYVTTARGSVLALNAATGQELWRHDPAVGTVTLCCGPVNNGVAAYGDKVYVASLDTKLRALDARSGQQTWETQLADPTLGYSATMAPLAADGRIFLGVSGQRYGIRGFIAAFDADSGEELWRWHTIPQAGEEGWWGEWKATDPFGTPLNRDLAAERADSASSSWSWGAGGGGIATTPAYDRATGRLFINVEGPAPLADGSGRPGDNLYTGSLVALDATTGERVWHTQYLPHDVWGLSGGSPPFLFDRGEQRYVGFAGRTGWIYVFDADTGRPVLRSDNFVPQESLFQTPTEEGAVRVAPGANGGNPGTGVAYRPDDGTAFVGGVHQPMVYASGSESFQPGQLWIGGTVRFPPDEEQWGTVSAIDLGSGEIRWQRRTPHPVFSDVLATAGGLVFVGQGSGTLDAFDADTGELLWQFETGAGVHGGPVTYAVGEVQYLVAPAGGSYHFETPPGDDLIAFALASRRPAVAANGYPAPDYTRHGATPAGQGGVRQVDTTPDTTPPGPGVPDGDTPDNTPDNTSDGTADDTSAQGPVDPSGRR